MRIQKLLIFFALSLISGSIFGGILYYSYTQEINQTKSKIEIQKQDQVTASKELIDSELVDISTDLIILSEHYELQDFLETNTDASREKLENEFKSFVNAKNVYDQARFIDKFGLEVIRVDYEDSEAIVTAQNDLQDKSDRYYFQESIILDKGDVYASPLDLNIENNEIEEPYIPVLRLATTIYDNQNQKQGIVIVNYLGEHLLSLLSDKILFNEASIELINSDGYWLKSSDKSQEWGFMFDDKQDAKYSSNNLDLWQKITENETGQFYTTDGLYTYSTIFPVNEINSNNQNYPNYYWKLVEFTPKQDIYSSPNENFSYILKLSIIPGILMILLLYFLSGAIINKRQYDKNIKSLNDLLKLINKTLRHDVLNNLTAAKYLIELNQEQKDPQKCTETTKETDKAIKRAIKVINEMRELESGIDSNIDPLEEQPLAPLIKEVSLDFDDIETTIIGNAKVKIDNGFRSVIENLLRNAIIHGKASNMNIAIKTNSAKTIIIFADNGKGIPDNIKPNLFKEGYSYGETGNTGLGLYIIKKTIERYGGEVKVSDNNPKGATFTISLPKI